MVVCHCLALNDAALTDMAAAEGLSVDAVAAACGAGSKCGGCRPLIAEVWETYSAQAERPVRCVG